ncbi:hypothetical protein CK224_04680 [Mesorhizobium sp. WSM3862]|nr:hypothetical protein CK224_04680 [Mesorhizobium sp. WSM3862]
MFAQETSGGMNSSLGSAVLVPRMCSLAEGTPPLFPVKRHTVENEGRRDDVGGGEQILKPMLEQDAQNSRWYRTDDDRPANVSLGLAEGLNGSWK